MTLIITCFNQECIVGIADSAIVDYTQNNKRIKDDAQKILRIPRLNSYIAYYGDAEIGGESTEKTIKKIIDMFANLDDLELFSEKFGEYLNKHYTNCSRSGFHIAGFDKKGEFLFFHWSNEDSQNIENSQNKFTLVSPSKEQLKREYSDPRYVYFFFNGDHKIFQIIFKNYTIALEELRKIMPNKNLKLKTEQIKYVGESLLKLIISTSEMFGYEHIGGKISSEFIHNKLITEFLPRKDLEIKTSSQDSNSILNLKSSLFNAGSFAPN